MAQPKVKTVHSVVQRVGDYEGEFIGVVDGEGVVGSIHYWWEAREMINITMVFIRPAFQGRGAGASLMRAFKRSLNKQRPGILYASGEVTSLDALKMMDKALGPALMIDNGIRCIGPKELPNWLPRHSPADANGRMDVERYLRTVHWIGPGRRRTEPHWVDCMKEAASR